MENSKEILQALERFNRLKQQEIPKELDDYFHYVAKTGKTLFQWSSLKHLFREKLLCVIKHFNDTFEVEEIPHYRNVDPFNFETLKSSLLERLDLFHAAPFTVQRLSELLIDPRKHYTRIDKFMRALEKNLFVVSSSIDLTEISNSLDSMDNGKPELEAKIDIEMENENVLNYVNESNADGDNNAALKVYCPRSEDVPVQPQAKKPKFDEQKNQVNVNEIVDEKMNESDQLDGDPVEPNDAVAGEVAEFKKPVAIKELNDEKESKKIKMSKQLIETEETAKNTSGTEEETTDSPLKYEKLNEVRAEQQSEINGKQQLIKDVNSETDAETAAELIMLDAATQTEKLKQNATNQSTTEKTKDLAKNMDANVKVNTAEVGAQTDAELKIKSKGDIKETNTEKTEVNKVAAPVVYSAIKNKEQQIENEYTKPGEANPYSVPATTPVAVGGAAALDMKDHYNETTAAAKGKQQDALSSEVLLVENEVVDGAGDIAVMEVDDTNQEVID